MKKISQIIMIATLLASCSENEREKVYCLDMDVLSDTVTISVSDLIEPAQTIPVPSSIPPYQITTTSVSDNYLCVASPYYGVVLIDRKDPSNATEITHNSYEMSKKVMIDELHGYLYITLTGGVVERYDLSTGAYIDSDMSVGTNMFLNEDGSIGVAKATRGDWRDLVCCDLIKFQDDSVNVVKHLKRNELVSWGDDKGRSQTNAYTSRNYNPHIFGMNNRDSMFFYDVKKEVLMPRFYIKHPNHPFTYTNTTELPTMFLTKIWGYDMLVATPKDGTPPKYIRIIDPADGKDVRLSNFIDGYFVKKNYRDEAAGANSQTVTLGKLKNPEDK